MLQASLLKDCRVCGKPFEPRNSMQAICWKLSCAKRVPVLARQAEKQTDKAKREAMRPLSYWVKQAQAAFNAWVRARDLAAGHGCIDCGKPFELDKFGGSVDAGHYLSRGSAPHLKFDERNVFAQRKNCNRPGGATRADFRAGVVARIGLEAVEALEADQSTKQYRADDLKAIRDTYRAKLKALNQRTG